jgi:hypothetical protein
MVIICTKAFDNETNQGHPDSLETSSNNYNYYNNYFQQFKFPLSDFQKWAIKAIVDGDNVLVTAHTGSGKTLPAEFALNYFKEQNKKVIYASPIKALSNQKLYDFRNKFPHISFGILTGDIKDIISKYSQMYQIQDIMDVKHIYGVSVSCLYGKILGAYSYRTFEAITEATQQKGVDAVRNNYIVYPEIKEFIKKLVTKVSYNGFIEVEFIIDKNDKIYIMECNPRISGSLRVPPYFDWLVDPYIQNYLKKPNDIHEIDLDNKSLRIDI